MTPEQTIARADRARQLLANELLIEAFEQLERESVEALLKTNSVNVAEQNRHRVKALRDVRRRLEAIVRHGAVAQAILDQTKG